MSNASVLVEIPIVAIRRVLDLHINKNLEYEYTCNLEYTFMIDLGW